MFWVPGFHTSISSQSQPSFKDHMTPKWLTSSSLIISLETYIYTSLEDAIIKEGLTGITGLAKDEKIDNYSI